MGLKALVEIERSKKIRHVKKNDRVVVLSGGDKGKQSRVLDVKPKEGKVLVEGVAVVKRHQRPNPTRGVQGGIIEKESYIDASKVMVISPTTGKPTRGFHKKNKQRA
ncbi:MAG: 50S ribosomal protein L24 [Blastocatellia bacterium]|nr:50S ribosomal protein L24 [Blastocatellia bacterium]